MKIDFINNIPENYTSVPVLISGNSTTELNERQYLSLTTENRIIDIFEIRYKHKSSPFKQADILKNAIGVGHEEHYYLYDISENKNIATLKLSGYFGYAYEDDALIYVTDANGLLCLDQDGSIIWENNALGIDGVIVHEFTASEIYGTGEWDPPGGWKDFVLDKKTGKKKTSTVREI